MVASHRPTADGYAKAPVIEAIIAVQFAEPLSSELLETLLLRLECIYSGKEDALTRVRILAEKGSVRIGEEQTFHKFIGEDPLDQCFLRPEGFSVARLAPYRDWTTLFDRMKRDMSDLLEDTELRFSRVSSRYINRIDIPIRNEVAKTEEFFNVDIKYPEDFGVIGEFSVQFLHFKEVEEIWANIKHSVAEAEIDGAASFILDIDVWKDFSPSDLRFTLDELSKLRKAKNDYYTALLTDKALGEFQ